ncbi:MAG TPA: hypothetical protein VIY28_04345, partial [Pseudonocardiaceae bacterium]
TSGLMKVVTGQFRAGGFTEPFGHPVLYVVCVVGPMAFLLSQNTFQQGTLIAPALAMITVVDPLVGVAIGVSWLGEQVNGSPGALAGRLASAAVLIASVVLLAYRGTQLRLDIEQEAGSACRATWG